MKTAAPLVPCVLLLLLLLVLTAGTAAADIVVPERPWRPAPPPGPHEVVVRVAAHLGPFAACDFGDRYVVRPGDTLMKIARDVLGDAKRWREIATLNPAFKPTVMPVGVHLLLPAVHPPAENYYAFFIVPSDHAAHALVQGHVLSHRSPDTTWRIAAVPLAG